MRQKLKIELPLNLLYKFPTIEALVERINLNEVDPTADFGMLSTLMNICENSAACVFAMLT